MSGWVGWISCGMCGSASGGESGGGISSGWGVSIVSGAGFGLDAMTVPFSSDLLRTLPFGKKQRGSIVLARARSFDRRQVPFLGIATGEMCAGGLTVAEVVHRGFLSQ